MHLQVYCLDYTSNVYVPIVGVTGNDGCEGDGTINGIADLGVAVCDGNELADIVPGRGDDGTTIAGGEI